MAYGGNGTVFTVRNYYEALSKILDALSSGSVDGGNLITIHDQSSDKIVEFPLSDVERQLALASIRFSIRNASSLI